MVSRYAKDLGRSAIPSNASTLGKAQGLVITPHLICYLTHYITRHVHNTDDVNDRVQDTLMEALQAYPGFNGDSALNTWLISIAKHKIAHYYYLAANAAEHLRYEDIAPNNGTEEDEVYQAVVLEEPLERLSSLSKECQQISYWHAVEGLNYAEIGKKLGISEDAVKMRIFRAKSALKKLRKNK